MNNFDVFFIRIFFSFLHTERKKKHFLGPVEKMILYKITWAEQDQLYKDIS